jgi:hypothetical protein
MAAMSHAPLSTSLALAAALAAGCSQQKASDGPVPPGTPAPAAPASAPAAKGESAADRDQVDPDGVVRRGVALSGAESLDIAAAYTRARELDGKTVKLTGAVESVCAKKGCWFVLRAGDRSVRITSEGYRFFVPGKIEGWAATVEGTLSLKVLDQATAQHFEDDRAAATGQPARKVEGPVEELGIAAVGVELRRGS